MVEFENLLTESKWKIIEIISKTPSSPIEIAQILNTTISNVTQQLKLLEFTGLVTKQRISNTQKGKPRVVYSLAHDFCYIITAIKNFSSKKLIHNTKYHNTILKIWNIDQINSHYYLEKVYWLLEPELRNVFLLAVTKTLDKLFIVSDNPTKIKKLLGSLVIKDYEGNTKKFDYEVYTKEKFLSFINKKPFFFDTVHVLYKEKIEKGGEKLNGS